MAKLAEAIAQKVGREGAQHLRGSGFVVDDVFTIIRQALATYQLPFYLNASERREQDCYWNTRYGVVTAPLVRSTMINCLYNVMAILGRSGEGRRLPQEWLERAARRHRRG